MILNVIRALFFILVASVASVYLANLVSKESKIPYVIMLGSVVVAFAIITIDMLVKRKNLAAISGLFLGILVGMLVSLGLGFIVDSLAMVFLDPTAQLSYSSLITGTKLLLGLMSCYLAVSFVLQTKDDFRFIIPYVEFSRATKGPRPLILDTSVIIDGRIADMALTGIFESRILVPRFVLAELQTIADSSDKLKRGRGRRGLDVLERIKTMPRLEVHFWDGTLNGVLESESVDDKLLVLANQENGRIVTNDYNLNKIAQLRGIDVINLNDIATTLKPVVLPGEHLTVRIVKPGESAGQGVGYLEDGTMVVVENARDRIGMEIELMVTNTRQTSAGKMIFGRVDGNPQRTVTAGATGK